MNNLHLTLPSPQKDPKTNKQKLSELQEEKKRLRDRIDRLSSTKTDERSTVSSYEENMTLLMQRKKQIETEKEKQLNLKKMQDEYEQRKKQVQRDRRLEQLQNQKRMIELQVGIKKAVFEGVKQKVKGMNSEQLMIRAMLREGHEEPRKKAYTSKGNVRRDFEQFIQTEHRNEYKQKWDVHELNERRFDVFEKKQQTVMRQVLLKQLISKGLDDEQINVLKMDKKQLSSMLQKFGIDIYDYMQAVPKQSVVQALPQISRQAQNRIAEHERKKKQEQQQIQSIKRLQTKLKQQLSLQPRETVNIARSLVYELIAAIVLDYEKRMGRYRIMEYDQIQKNIEGRYVQLVLESQDYQFAKAITVDLLQKIDQQFQQQAAQQIKKLHDLAHTKTQQCFQWMFKKGTNIPLKLKNSDDVQVQLLFQDQSGQLEQPNKNHQVQKQDYLKKFQDYQNNVFDVDKLTTEIVNEINLLKAQNFYFQKVSIKIHGEKQGPNQAFHILYDRQFYAITNDAVHNAKKTKVKLQQLGIDPQLKLLHWQKFHNFWLIHDTDKVSLYSPWGLQQLTNDIGQRIGNTCGKITSTQIFPIYTILGMACSIMLGFQKGQILKYNMNLNRIDNTQTNLSFYSPIIPQIKNGQQPPFPLQKKNTIKFANKKLTESSQLHQFRQFFDHHTSTIIGINFYKHNQFITVDKNLKCAIWYYDAASGPKSYTPGYTCEFISSYLIYKQSDNAKYKNIFPGGTIANESSQQLYQKWMLGEGFLRKLIFNNPQKSYAYFRANDDKEVQGEMPVWKFVYDENLKKVTKITQSQHTTIAGKMIAQSSKIWRQYLMILVQRDHSIINDLKTIKLYGWNIEERKMRSINLQFDTYKTHTQTQFQFLDNMLVGVDEQLIAFVNSGRILIYSLISGQLLRNLSDQKYLQTPEYSKYFFHEITTKRSLLGAATKHQTMQISLNDHNTTQKQKQLNKLIQGVTKKYINLL